MPERIASTDLNTQIKPDEVIGSGPFRFKRDEWNPGALAVWSRNPDYQPRQEGGLGLRWQARQLRACRVAHHPGCRHRFGGAAVGRGGLVGNPTRGPVPVIAARPQHRAGADELWEIGILRFNHLQSRSTTRRCAARWLRMSQADYSRRWSAAIRSWKHAGFFTPGTPMASEIGLMRQRGRAISRRRSGHRRRPATMARRSCDRGDRHPNHTRTESGDRAAAAAIGHESRLCGGGLGHGGSAPCSREPIERGGWSLFHTWWAGFDHADPAGHLSIREMALGPAAGLAGPLARSLRSFATPGSSRRTWLRSKRSARKCRLPLCETCPMCRPDNSSFRLPFAAMSRTFFRGRCRCSGT